MDEGERQMNFLRNVASDVKSLRYVALADPESVAPYDIEDSDPSVARRWWRIVRDENQAPVEIREVPTWEGKRLREFLHGADREAMDGFDGR